MAKQTVSLIDGSGFIFRAYYALPPLQGKDGTPLGAVYGFCNMLWRVISEKNSTRLAVIFDTPHKTFRNDLYSKYKANRSAPPEDLIPQFKIIREAVDAFGITRIEQKGYEADDLIATYTELSLLENWSVDIISSDKDLMQLVKNDVRMIDPMKSTIIERNEVIKKFGVPPEKVIEVQALAGDSVDNIPGVPGIGLKTASELINLFGDLEKVIENASTIKQPKRREAIQNNIENIKMSLKLVTLKNDIIIKENVKEISKNQCNTKTLLNFLDKYNINTLKKRIISQDESINIEEKDEIVKEDFSKVNYETIDSQNKLISWLNKSFESGLLVISVETDSLDAFQASLIGISLSCDPGIACYIPLAHKTIGESNDSYIKSQLKVNDVIKTLTPILKDPAVIKIGQNLKFDILVLRNYGVDQITPIDDTILLSYVLNAGLHKHNLNYLSEKYLSYKTNDLDDILGKGKNKITFDCTDIGIATNYAAEGTDITIRLWNKFKPNLIKEGLSMLYDKVEKPLIRIIVDMEKVGIKINKKRLEELSVDFLKQIKLLEKQIFNIVKKEFNIGSPKQLGEVLFVDLLLPGGKKNKLGSYSTKAEVLNDLASKGYEIPILILNWRELSKLKNTYTDSLVESINPKTNRVHTTFQMTGAQTGRLSSTEPNLQNIPIKTKNGREIRKSFISEDGYKLMCCDYSQIELRILAEIADIKTLKEAFYNGEDIHTLTASQILRIPKKEVDKEQRRKAKSINFGIIYGLSAFGLAKQIGVSRTIAKEYIESYFAQYPGIQDYMNKTTKELREKGYVKTLFGRKIHISGYNDKNAAIRGYAERQAINAPIQGTAADIIKRAMTKIPQTLKKKNLINSKMILQVHDELIFEVSNSELELCKKTLKELMETAHSPLIQISVPLKVDIGTGNNWDEAH